MAKPVIFSVDDDATVLSAISRDLRRRYGEKFRILRAESGESALEALEELQRREEAVALFLVDQRMPQMNGADFLARARRFFPDAQRVLLTAYADTEAAIQAINEAAIHHYLLKPWDPPEENLFPVLDDLLHDWEAGYRAPFEGVRVVGHRWSPETHQIKDFLARHQVPYRYFDVEQDQHARRLLAQVQHPEDQLPMVIFAGGEKLVAPTTAQLVEHLGLKTKAQKPFYDLAIIGGGPGGLAAAVYGASEGLHTVMIEREAPGGQAGASARIENYLGFPAGLSGADLARRATTQARRFGVEILSPVEVTGLRADGPYRIISLADSGEVACHAVVIAVGLTYRKLEIPGIQRLSGAGVYYGSSIVEALTCSGGSVYIVGSGNSAGQAALHLSEYASNVTLVVRGKSIETKMSQYLVQRIQESANIEVCLETVVCEVDGEEHVEAVTLLNERTGERNKVPALALFIFAGAEPLTDWLAGVVERDERGFILAGSQLLKDGKPPAGWPLDRPPFLLETSMPGVFVVGDVRSGSIKRVASAVGEGSIAIRFVHEYLSDVK